MDSLSILVDDMDVHAPRIPHHKNAPCIANGIDEEPRIIREGANNISRVGSVCFCFGKDNDVWAVMGYKVHEVGFKSIAR